jgi:hypothetical protein
LRPCDGGVLELSGVFGGRLSFSRSAAFSASTASCAYDSPMHATDCAATSGRGQGRGTSSGAARRRAASGVAVSSMRTTGAAPPAAITRSARAAAPGVSGHQIAAQFLGIGDRRRETERRQRPGDAAQPGETKGEQVAAL